MESSQYFLPLPETVYTLRPLLSCIFYLLDFVAIETLMTTLSVLRLDSCCVFFI